MIRAGDIDWEVRAVGLAFLFLLALAVMYSGAGDIIGATSKDVKGKAKVQLRHLVEDAAYGCRDQYAPPTQSTINIDKINAIRGGGGNNLRARLSTGETIMMAVEACDTVIVCKQGEAGCISGGEIIGAEVTVRISWTDSHRTVRIKQQ